jgi:hypothetical protein
MTPQTKLDQRRADFMERLYQASGRDNRLFTGLWEEYCLELGAHYRDTPDQCPDVMNFTPVQSVEKEQS